MDTTRNDDSSSGHPGFPHPKDSSSTGRGPDSSSSFDSDRPHHRKQFEIAILCALPIERDAIEKLFEVDYEAVDGFSYGKATGDSNSYTIGRIAGRHVVLAYMSGMGKVHAATAATSLRLSFGGIKVCFLVGICGVVPSPRTCTASGEDALTSIRLGDVVIAESVIQLDFGRQYSDGLIRKDGIEDSLGRCSPEIRSFIGRLKGWKTLKEVQSRMLAEAGHGLSVAHPGSQRDKPYQSTYRHKHQDASICPVCVNCLKDTDEVCREALDASCSTLGCSDTYLVDRPGQLEYNQHFPAIHFGRVASSDQVMRSGKHRDMIAKQEKVIAFEMEAAGVWEVIPTVLIKSACDYSDSHKSKEWQLYAAHVAASCTKAVLQEWRGSNPGLGPLGHERGTMKTLKLEHITNRPDYSMPEYSMPGVVSREALLQSLAYERIDSRQYEISLAHHGTCDWLFRTEEFRKWRDRSLEGNNGVLWIKGKPGAGKSTLLKHALLYCTESFSDHVIASYFFHARSGGLENSIPGLFRAITYQLIKQLPKLSPGLTSIYIGMAHRRRTESSVVDWNPRQLHDFLLLEMKKKSDKPIIIFIDALDECVESDVKTVVSFLQTLSTNAINAGNSLRICLSSRHYPTITMPYKLDLIVEYQMSHDDDIQLYIRDNLVVKNPVVVAEVAKKANGVFLWVVLVIGLLNHDWHSGRVTANFLRQKIAKTPSDIEHLFQEILENENEHMRETITILVWVLFSQNDLTPAGLYYAVLCGSPDVSPEDLGERNPETITDDAIERFIVSTSRGLIELRNSDQGKSVQFIHQTVNDFLLRNQRLQRLDSSLAGSDITGSCHDRLTMCCERYIVLGSDMSKRFMTEGPPYQSHPDWSNRRQLHPFLDYAYSHYFQHMSLAQKGSFDQLRRLRELGGDEKMLSRLFRYFSNTVLMFSTGDDVGDRLVYLLAHHNQIHLLDMYCVGGTSYQFRPRDFGGPGGVALQIAINSPSCVTLLLKAGADVNASGGHYGNALQEAVVVGSLETVEILLQAGADVDANEGYFGTAIQAAAALGRVDAMHLLLKVQADVNLHGGIHHTALHAAATKNNTEVAGLLLQAGANVNATDGSSGTAIQAAAGRGHSGMVKRLLAAAADVNIQGGQYGSPLHAAIHGRNAWVLTSLVKAGANINLQNKHGRTPIEEARYRWGQRRVWGLEKMLLSDKQQP